MVSLLRETCMASSLGPGFCWIITNPGPAVWSPWAVLASESGWLQCNNSGNDGQCLQVLMHSVCEAVFKTGNMWACGENLNKERKEQSGVCLQQQKDHHRIMKIHICWMCVCLSVFAWTNIWSYLGKTCVQESGQILKLSLLTAVTRWLQLESHD